MILRAYTGNPGESSHFKVLNFITSVKTPFPDKVAFAGCRGEDVDVSFGGPLTRRTVGGCKTLYVHL